MIWINGKVHKQEEAKISIDDRSFRYGDGLFETIIIVNKKLYQLDFHFDRLAQGLNAIKIRLNTEQLMASAIDFVAKLGIIQGFLRINITRGTGSHGYLPAQGATPNVVMQILKSTDYNLRPVKLIVSSYMKPPLASIPVNFKTNQALPSIMAAIEASEHGADEAVMLNDHGFVADCSSSNIFIVKGDILSTPSLSSGALMGSIRNRIINKFAKKYTIQERLLSTEDLFNADEVFITSVGRLVSPVRSISDLKEFSQFGHSKQIFEALAAEIGVAKVIAA